MKSIVTGCAGFIGSNLTEKLLSMKHEVIGIDRFSDYYPITQKEKNISLFKDNSNFHLIRKNIIDIDFKKEKIMDDVDIVFHLAAQAGVRSSWQNNFKIYVNDNILSTQKLLEASIDSGLKKFICASSSSVYGEVEKLPMKEDQPLKPVSPYGVSKYAAENLCSLYTKNFDLPSIILRYFTVYGQFQRPDMAIYRFIKSLAQGSKIFVYGDGNQTRDFTHISDIIEATILAIKFPGRHEVFNIGGGSRISISEIINILENLLKKKADIKYLENQKGDVTHTYADISKAKKKLGYEPKTKIEDGLEREIKWFLSSECVKI